MSLTLYLPESGTPEADGRVSGLFTPASRAERLREDGWTECGVHRESPVEWPEEALKL